MKSNQIKTKKSFLKSLNFNIKLFFKNIFSKITFLENRLIIWLLALNFLSNLVNWAAILIFMNKVDGNVILHYNVYFGVDAAGNWKKTFFMPIIGFFIFLLNGFLASFFYKKKERIASHVLFLASLAVQLSFLIASASIIIINY